MPLTIRAADPAEAAALSALCFAAKAHWGYDAAFMEKCRAALTVDPAAIERGDVFVATDAHDRPIAVHQVDGHGPVQELVLLFVEPFWIGKGIGRALLRHAATLARRRGAEALSILADPHAAAFYRGQGGVQVGDEPSDALPGRTLPLFRLAVS